MKLSTSAFALSCLSVSLLAFQSNGLEAQTLQTSSTINQQGLQFTYSLSSFEANGGTQLELIVTVLNTSGQSVSWTAPSELKGYWHSQGQKVPANIGFVSPRVVAIDANSFAKMSWRVEVPAQITGASQLVLEQDQKAVALLALNVTTEAGALVATQGSTNSLSTNHQSTVYNEGDDLKHSYEVSALERFRQAISTHEPVYFVVEPNSDKTARFQLSFKYRPFHPGAEENQFLDHLYLAYTQTSLWDLGEDSKPFRDTSYRPSLLWSDPVIWRQGPWTLGAATGYEHESNGKDGFDSRSIDILFAQPQLYYKAESLGIFSFSPRFHYYIDKDENPDITDYRGHVNWNLRWALNNGAVVSALLRNGSEGHSEEISFAYPLRQTWLSSLNGYAYVQYQGGYGDTLLEYNQRADSKVRFGLAIVP